MVYQLSVGRGSIAARAHPGTRWRRFAVFSRVAAPSAVLSPLCPRGGGAAPSALPAARTCTENRYYACSLILSVIMTFYFARGKQRAVAARGKIERLPFIFYSAVNSTAGAPAFSRGPCALVGFRRKEPSGRAGKSKRAFTLSFERSGKRKATLRLIKGSSRKGNACLRAAVRAMREADSIQCLRRGLPA